VRKFRKARGEVVDNNDSQSEELPKLKTEVEAATLYYKSECFYLLGDLKTALENLHSASEIAPENVGILYRYAVVAFEADYFALAKILCERLIKLNPDYVADMKDFSEVLMMTQTRTDAMAKNVGMHVPDTWREIVSDEERCLRLALYQNFNNQEALIKFVEFSLDKEKIRNKYGGGNNTLYKLH